MSVGLLALSFLWESAFGHLAYLADHSLFVPEMLGPIAEHELLPP